MGHYGDEDANNAYNDDTVDWSLQGRRGEQSGTAQRDVARRLISRRRMTAGCCWHLPLVAESVNY